MQSRKKIVHVVHSLQIGGLENGVVNLLNKMDGELFSHVVCCLTEAGTFAERIQASGVEIIELRLPSAQFHFPLIRLAKLFRNIAPDVVHSRGWSAIDASFAARLAGVPLVIHGEHGREHSDKDGSNWKRNQIRRVVGHIVDHYVIVCDFFRSWLHEVCGVAERKIIHIPNGVDTESFYPVEGQRTTDNGQQGSVRGPWSVVGGPPSAVSGQPSVLSPQSSALGTQPSALCSLRQSLGLPPEGVLIGSVGRLDPVKDFPTLLKGFREIKNRLLATTLVIVGDGPVRSDLTRLTQELGLDSAVLWLGERTEIPDLMRCFDVFVQTSIVEGMSNTILEAMASGLPIVTTATGGNPELVINQDNGILVPVGHVKKLAEALGTYVMNPGLRRIHGSSSRRRAANEFDLTLMANRYAELYETTRGK